MKTIEVVAAIVVHEGEVLCVRRGPHKLPYISEKWEFPGGKIEEGESAPQALEREIAEELHRPITVGHLLTTVDHTYPDFRILLHAYVCGTADRRLTLTEHTEYRWLAAGQLAGLDWAAADLPIVDLLTRSPE